MPSIRLSIFRITAGIAAVDKAITQEELTEIHRIGRTMRIPEAMIDRVVRQLRTLEGEQAIIDWLIHDIVAMGNAPAGLRANMFAEMLRTARTDGPVDDQESHLLEMCRQAWHLTRR